MDSAEELLQTNVSMYPRQRSKLEYLEKTTRKSMAQLIREAIDNQYPDSLMQPNQGIVQSPLQTQNKTANLKDKGKAIDSLHTGMTEEAYDKLFSKKNGT